MNPPSVALSLVGLPFAIAVGAVTGAVSFIPYIGMFIGTSLGVGIAIWQFWGDPVWIFAVAAIYGLGLFAESEVLVPRLVGDAVNLHPVWLIFAVIAFGTVFGFVGALIAVPLAAATGVIVRFAVQRYKQSSLYQGGAP
ncbi:AI-2E family transporter [Roseinatronobacter sp.]